MFRDTAPQGLLATHSCENTVRQRIRTASTELKQPQRGCCRSCFLCSTTQRAGSLLAAPPTCRYRTSGEYSGRSDSERMMNFWLRGFLSAAASSASAAQRRGGTQVRRCDDSGCARLEPGGVHAGWAAELHGSDLSSQRCWLTSRQQAWDHCMAGSTAGRSTQGCHQAPPASTSVCVPQDVATRSAMGSSRPYSRLPGANPARIANNIQGS